MHTEEGRRWSASNVITLIVIMLLVVTLFRLGNLEKEHNAIINQLEQEDNHLTQQINGWFSAEEFVETQ